MRRFHASRLAIGRKPNTGKQLPALPVLLLLALSMLGCDSPASTTRAALPTTQVRIGTGQFILEIADTEPIREHGLMKRDSMPHNHGMIFVFADERPRAFWMKNTRIPLDILYLDAQGKVVSIKRMVPYDETAVPSDAPAKYAIELNAGAAAAIQVKVGDTVEIPPEAREPKDIPAAAGK